MKEPRLEPLFQRLWPGFFYRWGCGLRSVGAFAVEPPLPQTPFRHKLELVREPGPILGARRSIVRLSWGHSMKAWGYPDDQYTVHLVSSQIRSVTSRELRVAKGKTSTPKP